MCSFGLNNLENKKVIIERNGGAYLSIQYAVNVKPVTGGITLAAGAGSSLIQNNLSNIRRFQKLYKTNNQTYANNPQLKKDQRRLLVIYDGQMLIYIGPEAQLVIISHLNQSLQEWMSNNIVNKETRIVEKDKFQHARMETLQGTIITDQESEDNYEDKQEIKRQTQRALEQSINYQNSETAKNSTCQSEMMEVNMIRNQNIRILIIPLRINQGTILRQTTSKKHRPSVYNIQSYGPIS